MDKPRNIKVSCGDRPTKTITLPGRDMYGNSVTETVEIPIYSRPERAKHLLLRWIFRGWWGHVAAYKLGLSKVRPIISIQVKG